MTDPGKSLKEAGESKKPERESPESSREDDGPRNLKDILKKSKRRGLVSKGQQGLVEFDPPPENE